NKDPAPLMKIAGVPVEQLSELMAKYEKRQIERCDALKTAFGALTKSPADDALKGKVRSLTHAIKGGGGTYGYHLTTTIATEADDLLDAKDTLDEADLHTLANHVAALSLVANKRISGDGGEAGRILLQGLKDFHSPAAAVPLDSRAFEIAGCRRGDGLAL
ncbi:hypothetical protein JYU08_00670, partial [bacterium AH-315-B06]|nr:hypothetical protein [bacterium AH-315-B06]